MPADTGLWISPCKQVHTFGMKFPIDVAFVGHDGEILHTQFADMLVYAGYEVAREEIDAKGRAAIEALTEIIETPEARHDFVFETGQIQIVDNRRLGHRRTAYTDWLEPERQRHLVRLWVRNAGRPFYHG